MTQASFVDAKNRFCLVLFITVTSYLRHCRLIWVSKWWTFHWCIDCGKCCLICRGRKLLGWPSYVCIPPQQ